MNTRAGLDYSVAPCVGRNGESDLPSDPQRSTGADFTADPDSKAAELGPRELEQILAAIAVLVFLAMLVVFATAGLTSSILQPAIIGFVHLLAIAQIRWLSVRVGTVFVPTAWMVAAITGTWFVDGLQGPAASLPVVALVMAGVLLGRRGAIVTAVAAVGFYVAFAVIDPASNSDPSVRPLEQLVTMRITIVAVLVIAVTRYLDLRKRAETNALASRDQMRAFYESILAASPVTVTVSDVATNKRSYVSPQFTRLTGIDLASSQGVDFPEVVNHVHPNDRETARESTELFLATDGAMGGEMRIRLRTPDGWRWQLLRLTVHSRHPDGSIAQLMRSGTDINQQVEADALNRRTLDASPAMIVIFDHDTGKIEFANPAHHVVTGYNADELNAMPIERWRTLIPAEEVGALLAARAEAMTSSAGTTVKHRFIRPDGVARWLEVQFVRFDPADPDSRRLLMSGIDVTERIEAEALAESVLRSTPALTVVFDPIDKRTHYANPAYTQSTGHTLDAINAMSSAAMADLTPASERQLVDAAIQRAYETDEVVSAERSYRGADGVVRWYDSRFVRLPTTEPRVLISGIDVTERKATEQALEDERTRLQRANQDLKEFVHIASHDLQEPLRTVAAVTQVLNEELDGEMNDEASTALDFVNKGVTRMRALVAGLSAHSRIGADRVIATIDSAAVVAEVIEDLANLIEREGATVDVGALPIMCADRIELRLIFQNLIANAVKFRANDRRPEIRVDAAHESGQWRFSVADNGIGIAPEHHERIFAIFQRLHDRANYEGTGIGLANCKRAVENHGGTIGIESRLGFGSTFWFTIPEGGTR